MRLFIAIDLPLDVKDYLYNLQKSFDKNLAKITWVSKKNLHLTLKFLGEIDASKLDEIKKILRNIKFSSFEVSLNNFTCFPDFSFPRVLWVALKPEDNIFKLAQLIDEETLLISKSDVQFKAHLTIGRVKTIKFKERFTEQLKKIKIEKIKFRIDSFTLYKSTLSAQGPSYDVVEKYKLD